MPWACIHKAESSQEVELTNQDLNNVKAIVLDIEGTTTPLDFVHRTLFEYASQNVEFFLVKKLNDPFIKKQVEGLKALHSSNTIDGQIPETWDDSTDEKNVESASTFVRFLISIDSKDQFLKSLQGVIWEEAFRKGRIKGEVYEDVPVALKRWAEAGLKLCIYSSGSVLAQKLIFGTTQYGDLTRFITEFFDTAVGTKRDPDSYRNISESLHLQPKELLFLSDVIEEVDASRKAGLESILVKREATDHVEGGSLKYIVNFDGLL